MSNQDPTPPSVAATPARSRKTAFIIAGIVGAVVLVLAAAGVAVFLLYPRLLGRQGNVVPIEPAHLPKTTSNILQIPLNRRILSGATLTASAPEEMVWSSLASGACGGTDLFSSLMNLPEDTSHIGDSDVESLARALSKDIVATQLALRCGRNIARDDPTAASVAQVIEFSVKDKPASVVVVHTKLDAFPDTDPPAQKHSFREHKGVCLPRPEPLAPDGSPGALACGDTVHAVAMLEGQWITGTQADLDEFMRQYDNPADELPLAAEVVSGLAPAVHGFDMAGLSTDRDARLDQAFGEATELIELSEVRKLSMVPSDLAKRTADVLSTRIRGTGMGVTAPDVEHGPRIRYAFLAKDEDAAKAVVTELDDFRKEWRAYLENKGDEIGRNFQESVKSLPETPRAYKEALFDVLVRGIAKAVVGRSGVVVTFDMSPEPKEGEQKSFRLYLVSNKDRAATAARIVRALASGREPEPADLEAMGSKKLVDKIAELKTKG